MKINIEMAVLAEVSSEITLPDDIPLKNLKQYWVHNSVFHCEDYDGNPWSEKLVFQSIAPDFNGPLQIAFRDEEGTVFAEHDFVAHLKVPE